MAKKTLKEIVDEELRTMLKSTDEPSEGRMKLLAISLKKIAIDAKLEEAEYGDFFTQPGTTSGNEKGEKPASRKRAPAAADAELDDIIDK